MKQFPALLTKAAICYALSGRDAIAFEGTNQFTGIIEIINYNMTFL
jgi:hypothetical protein